MGLTRQSVQRVADLLVQRELAEYLPNPAHARAKLLAPTDAGWAAIDRLRDRTLAWAGPITAAVGEQELRQAIRTMDTLIASMSKPGPDLTQANPPPDGQASRNVKPRRRRLQHRSTAATPPQYDPR
jgi:hypothetical protein